MLADAAAAEMPADERTLSQGGCGAAAYADAVAVYLALGVDKAADYWSAITSWNVLRDGIRNTFARQAIPMVWDFAEVNCFSDSTGNYMSGIDWIVQVIENIPCERQGEACQRDATASINGMSTPLISTDPPYYDNIGYADLSDFFCVWLTLHQFCRVSEGWKMRLLEMSGEPDEWLSSSLSWGRRRVKPLRFP